MASEVISEHLIFLGGHAPDPPSLCMVMHQSSPWLYQLKIAASGPGWRRALECGFVALNNTSTHCHTYHKYTTSLWNTDASMFWIHSDSLYGDHIIGLHCICGTKCLSHTPNKDSVCAVRTLLGVNWKMLCHWATTTGQPPARTILYTSSFPYVFSIHIISRC